MEYLLELRRRLLYCFIFTIILFSTLCFFANPLYQGLAKPLVMQLSASHLIATKITAPFLVPLKFVLFLSIFLLIPLFFYHVWSFVAPALYPHERKKMWMLIMPSIVLFYIGVLFAYFLVLPLILSFFIKTVPANVELLPEIGQYLDFALQMLLAFGLVFEVPIIVLVIVYFNLVTLEQLSASRRYIIVLAFVIGMLLTPPDVFSQVLLAIPIWVLFELGLFLAKIINPSLHKGEVGKDL